MSGPGVGVGVGVGCGIDGIGTVRMPLEELLGCVGSSSVIV